MYFGSDFFKDDLKVAPSHTDPKVCNA